MARLDPDPRAGSCRLRRRLYPDPDTAGRSGLRSRERPGGICARLALRVPGCIEARVMPRPCEFLAVQGPQRGTLEFSKTGRKGLSGPGPLLVDSSWCESLADPRCLTSPSSVTSMIRLAQRPARPTATRALPPSRTPTSTPTERTNASVRSGRSPPSPPGRLLGTRACSPIRTAPPLCATVAPCSTSTQHFPRRARDGPFWHRAPSAPSPRGARLPFCFREHD